MDSARRGRIRHWLLLKPSLQKEASRGSTGHQLEFWVHLSVQFNQISLLYSSWCFQEDYPLVKHPNPASLTGVGITSIKGTRQRWSGLTSPFLPILTLLGYWTKKQNTQLTNQPTNKPAGNWLTIHSQCDQQWREYFNHHLVAHFIYSLCFSLKPAGLSTSLNTQYEISSSHLFLFSQKSIGRLHQYTWCSGEAGHFQRKSPAEADTWLSPRNELFAYSAF